MGGVTYITGGVTYITHRIGSRVGDMIGFRVGLLTRSLRSLVAGRAGGQNCGMKMRKSIACDYAMCYNDIAMDKNDNTRACTVYRLSQSIIG